MLLYHVPHKGGLRYTWDDWLVYNNVFLFIQFLFFATSIWKNGYNSKLFYVIIL